MFVMNVMKQRQPRGLEGRFFLPLALLLLLLVSVPAAFAEEQADPSAAYLQAYIAFQDGGRFEKLGDVAGAKRRYGQSIALFEGVRRSFPSWNPKMVEFRNRKVMEALQSVEAGSGGSTLTGQKSSTSIVIPNYPPGRSTPSSSQRSSPGPGLSGQIQNQIDVYEEQIRQLQEANRKIREELDSQKRVVKDSIAKIAAAKNEEASAMNRIARIEQELEQAKKGDSSSVAFMEREKSILKRQLLQASTQLEKANEETSRLLGALENSNAAAVRYQAERDAVIKERDQMELIVSSREDHGDGALVALAEKNSMLQKKLQAAQDEMEGLSRESRNKDIQIARLESRVRDVREELVAVKRQSSGYVATIADLENRLESTMRMLDDEGGVEDAPEELLAENALLRGLIVRQLRQQVRQQQTNQLVRYELEQLEGASQELIDRLAKLSEDRPILNPEERALLVKYDLAPEEKNGINAMMMAKAASPSATELASAVKYVESAGDQKNTPEEIAKRAEDAFFTKDFPRAEQLYEEFVETDPSSDKHGLALANLGVVRMRLKKFEAAQQALTKARAIHPDNAFVHFMLGMSHYWQGRNGDALLALENAAQLDPDNVKVHYYVGITSARLGEFKGAERGFLEAITLDPAFAPAHFNLAVLYAVGDGSKEACLRAEQHYRRAIDIGFGRDPTMERLFNEAKALAEKEGIGKVSG